MTNEIHNIRLKFKCPSSWDEMTPMAGGRFCDHCAKIVYDFTDAKQAEFAQVMREHGNGFCGRFRAEQMAPPSRVERWKKWFSAAVLLIGTSILSHCKRDYQNEMIALPEKSAEVIEPMVTAGIPLLPNADAEFNGGPKALKNFIANAIHFPKGYEDVSGNVIVSFTINEDGSVKDFKIKKGSIDAFNHEALRVLKLMPNWLPALSHGIPVKSTYTLPINFTIADE